MGADEYLLRQDAVNGLRTVKPEAEAFLMWALDKKPLRGEADGAAASPVLIVVALALFLVLLLATIDLHREMLILAIGNYGIEPALVGP
jgi:hypothetical protein